MAMTMQKRFSMHCGQVVRIGMATQELTKQGALRAQPRGPGIVWKQTVELIAKDRSAAWFEKYDGEARVYFRTKPLHDLQKIGFRPIEHSEIIERTAATEMRSRHNNLKSSSFQYIQGGKTDLGMEVVCKRVSP